MKKTEFRRIYNAKNLLFFKKWTLTYVLLKKKIIIIKKNGFLLQFIDKKITFFPKRGQYTSVSKKTYVFGAKIAKNALFSEKSAILWFKFPSTKKSTFLLRCHNFGFFFRKKHDIAL